MRDQICESLGKFDNQRGRPCQGVADSQLAHVGRVDLRIAMARAEPQKKVMLAYLLYIATGQTALSDLQTERYGDLKPERFDSFVRRSLATNA